MDKVSGGPPSPMVAEAIREYAKEMDAEAIIRAFDIAIAERTFKWSYIDGILRQFKADGVRTVEDVIRRDAEYKEKKAKREGRKDARSNGDDRSDSKSDRKLDGATYL
jgi:DnaD/phage-associated family protein